MIFLHELIPERIMYQEIGISILLLCTNSESSGELTVSREDSIFQSNKQDIHREAYTWKCLSHITTNLFSRAERDRVVCVGRSWTVPYCSTTALIVSVRITIWAVVLEVGIELNAGRWACLRGVVLTCTAVRRVLWKKSTQM